jgi:hypothetical protein
MTAGNEKMRKIRAQESGRAGEQPHYAFPAN